MERRRGLSGALRHACHFQSSLLLSPCGTNSQPLPCSFERRQRLSSIKPFSHSTARLFSKNPGGLTKVYQKGEAVEMPFLAVAGNGDILHARFVGSKMTRLVHATHGV